MCAEVANELRAIGAVLLGDLDDLVDRVATAQAPLPGFDWLASDVERRAYLANAITRIIHDVLLERHPATPEDVALVEAHFEARARAGLTLDAYLSSTQILERELWAATSAVATQTGASTTALSEAASAMHELASHGFSVATSVFRKVETELAAADQRRLDRFLHDLLLGPFPPEELATRAAPYELVPTRRYVCFRARTRTNQATDHLQYALREQTRPDRTLLIGTVAGDAAGLLDGIPRIDDPELIIGVGPPADLTDMVGAFQSATRALDTAWSFDLAGVHALDQLGARPAIVSEIELGDRLVNRYLAPLDELGDFGAVLEETIRTYLDHGMRIEATARALFVHHNSLRYRLHRYEQLTGADLRRTEDLFLIWWALARKATAQSSRPLAPEQSHGGPGPA